jgi:ligand-binding SRPBCC domain-containing protein
MSQRFETEHWVPAPLPHVFAFFADPHNLPRIMPPSKGARLVKLNLVPPRFSLNSVPPGAGHMAGVGTELVLKFRVIPYVPIHERWTALITGFSLNQFFSDVQKQGPFHRWEHTHSFEATVLDGLPGTLIRDVVEYEVGFGVIGAMLEHLMFRRMLRNTFDFRKKALERIFSENAAPSGAM